MTDDTSLHPTGAAASKRDLSVSLEQASIQGVLMMLPPALAFIVAFCLLWSAKLASQGAAAFFDLRSFLPALIVGTVIHELLHGIGWAIFGKKPWRVIKFGFVMAALTPYAQCKEPLEVGVYRIGAALPGLMLGLAPVVFALWFGNAWWLMFGVIFTIAAGGDALILWLIRGVKRGALVEDHASRAGCYVIDPVPSTPPAS